MAEQRTAEIELPSYRNVQSTLYMLRNLVAPALPTVTSRCGVKPAAMFRARGF